MRKTFTHVFSLLSGNVANIYAGGFHSWIILDDIIPKKEDIGQLKDDNQDSPLNSQREDLSVGGVSQADVASNWNFQNSRLTKFILQVNYTDTSLSHRFIRFELPEKNQIEGLKKVNEYITQTYKEEGTRHHKLQEDQDLHGEAGQVVSAGTGKNGKYYTLQLVCDIAKAEETVEPRRTMVKGDYSFANEVYEIYMK